MRQVSVLVAIDWIMCKTIGNKRRGIRWTLTSLLEDLDFADDVALVSSTTDQLQRKTSDLSLAANQLSLNISRKKTKTLQLTETPLPVELENKNLEEGEEFTYLGSIMSKSNATVKDITNRLQKAKSSFLQLNKVWRSPSLLEWNGKDDKIIRYVMINDFGVGGLKMIDISSFNKSLKITWIKKNIY